MGQLTASSPKKSQGGIAYAHWLRLLQTCHQHGVGHHNWVIWSGPNLDLEQVLQFAFLWQTAEGLNGCWAINYNVNSNITFQLIRSTHFTQPPLPSVLSVSANGSTINSTAQTTKQSHPRLSLCCPHSVIAQSPSPSNLIISEPLSYLLSPLEWLLNWFPFSSSNTLQTTLPAALKMSSLTCKSDFCLLPSLNSSLAL